MVAMHLLTLSPQLKHYALHGFENDGEDTIGPLVPVRPAVETFSLGFKYDLDVLEHLTIPKLTTFSIFLLDLLAADVPVSIISSFFLRSSCTITSLE